LTLPSRPRRDLAGGFATTRRRADLRKPNASTFHRLTWTPLAILH